MANDFWATLKKRTADVFLVSFRVGDTARLSYQSVEIKQQIIRVEKRLDDLFNELGRIADFKERFDDLAREFSDLRANMDTQASSLIILAERIEGLPQAEPVKHRPEQHIS